jgi:hypothetical protein
MRQTVFIFLASVATTSWPVPHYATNCVNFWYLLLQRAGWYSIMQQIVSIFWICWHNEPANFALCDRLCQFLAFVAATSQLVAHYAKNCVKCWHLLSQRASQCHNLQQTVSIFGICCRNESVNATICNKLCQFLASVVATSQPMPQYATNCVNFWHMLLQQASWCCTMQQTVSMFGICCHNELAHISRVSMDSLKYC